MDITSATTTVSKKDSINCPTEENAEAIFSLLSNSFSDGISYICLSKNIIESDNKDSRKLWNMQLF